MCTLSSLTAVRMCGEGAAPEEAWQMTGAASVRITYLPSGVLLREKGRLERNELSLAYQASWSFETDAEGILWLGHARQGTPLRLLNLRSVSDTEWTSDKPHVCGEDLYEARITRVPGSGLQLQWQTRGPRKKHRITRNFTSSYAP